MACTSRRVRLTLLALTALLTSCVTYEAPAASEQAVAVPGPWVAPDRVRAIAASHFVPVVDPPPVRPDGSCASTNPFTCSCSHPACIPAHPGTNELREYLLRRFPDIRNYGTYCCRQNSNRRDHLSVHAVGRAIDLGVPFASGGQADNTIGDAVANFLVEHAEYIGIQRVIWDHTFWNGERGWGSLGGSPHTDHLHIELSVAGAARDTPFFTVGPPGTTCEPACEGAVLVGRDCSRTDCAAGGMECLAGDAPRCGVPEPPAAVPVADARLPALTLEGEPARLTFVGPERVFDTRDASPGAVWNAAGDALTWTSEPGPRGAWLNVAMVPSGPSFVSVAPAGAPRPATSSLNSHGVVRANLVPSPLGDGDAITLHTSAPMELIGDRVATLGDTGAGLELVDPRRALDTRSLGAPLEADAITPVDVEAPEGAIGVLATVAAILPGEPAHVAVFPCGVEPDTSTVNLLPDEVASNQVVTGLGPDGRLCLRASAPMHVVLDVLGFFSAEGRLEYQALAPTRLVDTRDGLLYEHRLAARQTLELTLADAPGMPDDAWAAVFNVATVEADGRGHLVAHACEREAPPPTSAHNFAEAPRSTLVTTDLGTSRRACVTTTTRAHVIVDLLGVWRRRDGALPPEPMPIPEPTEPPLTEDDDAGSATLDAGVSTRPDSVGSCACRATGRGPAPSAWLLALALGLAGRSSRRRPGA